MFCISLEEIHIDIVAYCQSFFFNYFMSVFLVFCHILIVFYLSRNIYVKVTVTDHIHQKVFSYITYAVRQKDFDSFIIFFKLKEKALSRK